MYKASTNGAPKMQLSDVYILVAVAVSLPVVVSVWLSVVGNINQILCLGLITSWVLLFGYFLVAMV